jgi:hypothetical protein
MTKLSARWVPKLLIPLQKQQRVECYREFLELCHDNEKEVIESIVTGDGTMVLYYDPQSKRESIEWRRRGEPLPRKARRSPSTKKNIATIFWDSKGIGGFLKTGTPPYIISLLHKL